MLTILSLVTSVKDYIEVLHKLIETDSMNGLNSYYDFGAGTTFVVLAAKEIFSNFFSLKWLQTIWSIPTLVPDIASAMISEISIFNGSFKNTMTLLEQPISYGNQNLFFYCLEKFMVGAMNSLFLFLPTSTAHIITLRRFVMQGLEAGYIAGLGTIAGNFIWIGSIVFGLRFLVIPWLSFDILRYLLGFILLVKYMWDSYSERRSVLDDLSKSKIFLLNFLLAFTEQTNLFPFLSNLSIGSDSTLLETFPNLNSNVFEFFMIHGFYLIGILVGSLSLLQLTCWFWENPAYNFYIWIISSFKVTTTFYYKFLNFLFLYLTMICAISNVTYLGLDYTITNPLGFTHEDRLVEQKVLLETSFLNSKASDRNTRRNRGRHGRRERWKRRVRRYRTFDASLYDQGTYDLFTIEDLNYGFDRFWLRRKIRNHRVRFRFFPGPWMRSFKKQLTRPRLESFMGPRIEFFRILFEQAYHPEFHEFRKKSDEMIKVSNNKIPLENFKQNKRNISIYLDQKFKEKKQNFVTQNSALRKFLRKTENRVKLAKIQQQLKTINLYNKNNTSLKLETTNLEPIYSKRWKYLFSKISHNPKKDFLITQNLLEKFYQNSNINEANFQIKQDSQKRLSNNEKLMLRYKTFLKDENPNLSVNKKNKFELYKPITLLHPLKYYLQQEKAFKKKLNFYGVNQYRNFEIEKNAPYFRVMMKRFFYYYKPTLRWERTMRVATMRKARRKGSRIPRKLNLNSETKALATISDRLYNQENLNLTSSFLLDSQKKEVTEQLKNSDNDLIKLNKIQKPTHFYSLVSKRASRYRYEIYKDVLQHWYYSPFNRLLLKFDVDSFIRRQPKNHFLTKKDENLLHFKRFLMSEYYNSLRWYTYMQHYDSMKSKISNTKTLTSRVYNQQFIGTFKKIRHLFAITPFSNDQTVLKFDQPLYNEFSNDKNQSLLSNSVFHEEILADEDFKWIFSKNENFDSLLFTDSPLSSLPSLTPLMKERSERNENKEILKENETQQNNSEKAKLSISDLKNQSADILREYLKKATPIRQEYIQYLLNNKDYSELTKFLFRGQKLRGVSPITNEKDFLLQEKNALLKNQSQIFTDSNILEFNDSHNFLWFELLKKCHNKLYDQKALKNYVLSRVDKHEKQKQRKQKNLKLRIERIKNWYVSDSQSLNTKSLELPSAYIKAIKEAYNISVKNRKTKQKKYQKFTKSQKILLKDYLNLRLENSFNKINSLSQNFKKIYNSNASSGSNIQNISKLEKTMNFVIQSTLMPFKYFLFKLKKENFKEITQGINFNFFNKFKVQKDLNKWRKTETVLSKRKKIRKTLKRLRNNKNLSNILVYNNDESNNLKDFKKRLKVSSTIRKKKDLEEFQNETIKKSYSRNREKTWQNYTKTSLNFIDSVKENLFTKKFKKRRSRMRRYRFLKGRGPIKKRTLGEKLKGQFRFLKKYAAGSSKDVNDQEKIQNKKLLIFNNLLNQKSSKNKFETREIKQRRTRIRKHRFWKKHKKQKDALVRRKIKKRRRYGKAKIRVLNKKLKNIKGYNDVKKWWWQEFLPNFKESTDNAWQTFSFLEIKNELKELSIPEMLERDKLNSSFLQIGDKDYKPLAIPEAIRIRDAFLNPLSNQTVTKSVENLNAKKEEKFLTTKPENLSNNLKEATTVVDLTTNIILNSSKTENSLSDKKHLYINNKNKKSPFMVAINPMPFYAGWDESSRKFVITNRLLSRKDAGYSFTSLKKNKKSETSDLDSEIAYLKAPFNGMNAPTTLYWQIPFTTYDPDQFFALGMDGFSPIGWRNFHFKSSKQTTKPILVKKIEANNNSNKFSENLNIKFINKTLKNSFSEINENRQNQINLYNRIQKRYKRVKKHPRPPVWFPSGTLANQVLPVHYIYVFYKRYRLPRDRYVRRKLKRNKNQDLNLNIKNLNQWTDYTLRKRSKPKRKYHRKNLKMKRKNEDFLAHLKRRKFRGFADEKIRFRPISESQKLKELKIRKKRILDKNKSEKNRKQKGSKENLRLRQLRRRVQRQVFRPVWRYKPQSGGFVWPGDYLRLELVKAPKLQILNSSTMNLKVSEKQRSIRKKKRRIIQEWQVQPKKYFLQKHNIKVLKKRLQKSQNFTLL